MRKLIISTLIILLYCLDNCNAQQRNSSTVGLAFGYMQNGLGLKLNYDYNLSRREYLQGSILLGFARDKLNDLNIKVPYDQVYFNTGYFYEIGNFNRDGILINIGGGASFGYQILNDGNQELSNGALIVSKTKFVYGVFVGADVKFYVSDNWTATIHLNEYYHANSDIGYFTPFIGASINYTLF